MSAQASALSRALHETLASDADLSAIIRGRIFDRVPDRASTPYLTHGTLVSRPLDAEGVEEHAVTLDAWSRGHGRREVQDILAALDAALRDTTPARASALASRLSSGGSVRLVSIARLAHEIVSDDDTDLEHAIARYRVVTEAA